MKKIIPIASIIAAVFSTLLIITGVLAWFTGIYREDITIDGRVNGGYFAGGTGEEENPYIIKNQKHMRNLALLQNNGKFNIEENTTYYFKISDDIEKLDMSGIWIPPIGTTTNPFKGNFDGNNKVIEGLRVTTNEKLSGSKITSSAFTDVGFFGSVEGENAKIQKFNLDDIYVDHNIDATYSGIIAGEAPKDSIQYVGVHTARLGYEAGKKANSNYALIGNTDAHTITDDDPGNTDPGGDGPGGDVGQFVPDVFYNVASTSSNLAYVSSIADSTLTLKPASWIIPDSTDKLGLGSFSFTTHQTSATTMKKGNIPHFYYVSTSVDNDNNYDYGLSLSKGKLYSPLSGTTKVYMDSTLNESDEQKRIRGLIKNGTEVLDDLDYYFDWANTFSSSSKGASYSVIGEGGSSIETANYNIYDSTIKVTVTTDNPKIFVIATGVGKRAFAIYKASDYYGTEDNNGKITWDYSTYKSQSENSISKNEPVMALVLPQASGIYTCKNTSCSSYETVFDDSSSTKCNTCNTKFTKYGSSGDYITFACEFDLSGCGKGTYLISPYNGANRLHYLSVEGVEDGDTGGGTEDPVTTIYYIDKVDFVSSATEFITDNHEYSYVLFVVAVDTTNEIVIYFKKDEEDSKVKYGTSNETGVTISDVNDTYPGTEFSDFNTTDYPAVQK